MIKQFFFALCLLLLNSGHPDARIYFIHVPKTGGTTLRLLLEQELSASEIFPFRNPRQAKRAVSGRLISGHFPYSFCQKLDKEFDKAFKITILREPVERYLSFLRAKKKTDKSLPDLESVLQQRLEPRGRYHDELIDNALCRHLASNPHLEGKALLKSAKENLHKLDCVIFMDNFAEDIVGLFKRLGITLTKDKIPHINTTPKESANPKLLLEVKRLNLLDIELYAYAKAHLKKKLTTYPLRTESYASILEKTTAVDYTFDLPLNGSGWTYREPMNQNVAPDTIYRWVMDKPALIHFCLEKNIDYDIFFSAQVLTDQVVPSLNINGYPISLSKLDNELFATYYGKIPKEYITDELAQLSFSSSQSFFYKDIHPMHRNRNHPPLSFAVKRIKIIECP